MKDGVTMETELLARSWREATDGLAPKADFTERVVRGGRRRSVRRRLRVSGILVAVVALLLGGGLVYTGGDGIFAAADPRLSEPTHGDLAGDAALRAAVVTAWRQGIKVSYNADRGIFDDARSDPHVYWAGTTPAGPAAVVLQRFFLHRHGNLASADWNEMQTLVGLVGTDPVSQRLTLLTDQYRADGFPEPGYFQFGNGDRTVLVLRRDLPVYESTRATVAPDGRTVRDWRPLVFLDGVSVLQVPAGEDPYDVRLLARPVRPDPADKNWDGLLLLEPASEYLRAVSAMPNGSVNVRTVTERGLQWTDVTRVGQNRTNPADPRSVFNQALADRGALDIGTLQMMQARWCIVAGLSDGTTALVSEVQEDDHPSRLYAVLVSADGSAIGLHGGTAVDPAAPLPVAVRLANGQGWVVAAYGSQLAYRSTPDGTWTDAGRDAALLPDTAVQVQVRAAAGPVTVDLAR